MRSYHPESRRRFLQSAAALSAAAAGAPAAPLLPVVRFGNHDVTRLIVGTNPFFGYSHSLPMLDRFMKEWMTQDRRMDVLHRCEQHGINTWQLHYSAETMADLKRFRSEGGRVNWFLLGHDEMMKEPMKYIPAAVKEKPIGIAHHGGWTDDRFRDKQMHLAKDFCKMVRDAGVMAGVSTHNPVVVDYIESQNWDIDYYMTCFYRISRTRGETRTEFGEAPLGEPFFEKDPERMTKVIRQTRRPCLAFKILGAGRTVSKREDVERSFRFALENIKPTDAVIVGMCPRFKDEVKENSDIVRALSASAT